MVRKDENVRTPKGVPNPRQRMPSLCVLILQFNRSELTLNCVESIARLEDGLRHARIILMDNGSSEAELKDNLATIKASLPHIEIVEFEQNLGFAGAHNEIIKQVSEDYILLLNNDTVLQNAAITSLCHGAFEDGVDAATGRLINPDYTTQSNTRGYYWFPEPWTRGILVVGDLFRRIFSFKINYKRGRRIVYANGAFLLLNRKVFEDIGAFDGRFFMYAEDLDLMIKLNKAGADIRYYCDATVLHLNGATSSEVWTDEERVKLQIAQANACIKHHYGPLVNYLFAVLYLLFAQANSFSLIMRGCYEGAKHLRTRAFWRLTL